MENIDFIYSALEKVRSTSPLVLSITNYVTANINANTLLAVGASPIMSHQIKEVEDLTRISDAVVTNMGIPLDNLVESIFLAGKWANKIGKPLIFDPVGVGASKFRNEICAKMLNSTSPDIIKGNASEIMALAGQENSTKGVDSSHASIEAEEAARLIALKYSCTVCVSGEIDLITDGCRKFLIENGHPLMARITGLGCSAGVLAGAFATTSNDKTESMVSCMAVLGIAGEIAAETAEGPASMQLKIIDKLYTITKSEIENRLKLSCQKYS
ncbi:hydroxyethylthiazole kinase [Maridesulfovibrio bastinii]|uniref:hydroxyethylthiazole kinase n=1 Tax=Maridesulfovibrio bastinii TaxID=47157 RepID=UPI0004141882|nr:hydroxyethylthiazole kinase [Maridesulfovibrio bastinii]